MLSRRRRLLGIGMNRAMVTCVCHYQRIINAESSEYIASVYIFSETRNSNNRWLKLMWFERFRSTIENFFCPLIAKASLADHSIYSIWHANWFRKERERAREWFRISRNNLWNSSEALTWITLSKESEEEESIIASEFYTWVDDREKKKYSKRRQLLLLPLLSAVCLCSVPNSLKHESIECFCYCVCVRSNRLRPIYKRVGSPLS